MNDFEEFAIKLATLDFLSVDESHTDDTYTIKIRCGNVIVVERNIIKCECETPEEMQKFMMPKVLEDLYIIGYDGIIAICEWRPIERP